MLTWPCGTALCGRWGFGCNCCCEYSRALSNLAICRLCAHLVKVYTILSAQLVVTTLVAGVRLGFLSHILRIEMTLNSSGRLERDCNGGNVREQSLRVMRHGPARFNDHRRIEKPPMRKYFFFNGAGEELAPISMRRKEYSPLSQDISDCHGAEEEQPGSGIVLTLVQTWHFACCNQVSRPIHTFATAT